MFFLLIVKTTETYRRETPKNYQKRRLDLGCQVTKNRPDHGKKQYIINYLNDESSSYSHFLNLKNNKTYFNGVIWC